MVLCSGCVSGSCVVALWPCPQVAAFEIAGNFVTVFFYWRIVKHHYIKNWFSPAWAGALLAFVVLLSDASAGNDNVWAPLAKDDIHDPKGPGITLLQEPSEGLSPLPRDKEGNMVNWVEAITKGVIAPRRLKNQQGALPGGQPPPDVLLDKQGSMPMVPFPHKTHSLWLDCSNCHPAIFAEKAGASGIRMEKILAGEQCGICHGAVAFPPTECNRCHSMKRADEAAKPR